MNKNFIIYEVSEDTIYEWKLAALKAHKRTSRWVEDILNKEVERVKGQEVTVGDLKKMEVKEMRKERIAGEVKRGMGPLETRVNVIMDETPIEEVNEAAQKTEEDERQYTRPAAPQKVEIAAVNKVDTDEAAKRKAAELKRLVEAGKEMEKRWGKK